MVASKEWAAEARDKIHNLNLSCKEHEEYYNTIVEEFIWQNEAYWDDETREPKYKGNGRDVRRAYPDIKDKMTVGVGFNMDTPSARDEWKEAFGGAVSFDAVRAGTRILEEEEVWQLFRAGLASRRKELKAHFGDDSVQPHLICTTFRDARGRHGLDDFTDSVDEATLSEKFAAINFWLSKKLWSQASATNGL